MTMQFHAPEAAITAILVWGAACPIGLLRPPGAARVAALLSIAACGLCLTAAFLPGGIVAVRPPIGLAGVAIGFRVDSLSRWFLGLIGVVGLAASIYSPGYLKHLRGRARPGFVWSGLTLLFASMA
ncbi:MAG: hypothetical protein HY248_05685, partial [Fimbriimonas ginsengisoli]|nr:hypothetical protein [Fimbriimonas ginsengisoli]